MERDTGRLETRVGVAFVSEFSGCYIPPSTDNYVKHFVQGRNNEAWRGDELSRLRS